MYDGLETNIPDILMAHSDDQSLLDHKLFPSRQDVLHYLQDYAADIKDNVFFNTQITDVRYNAKDGQERWIVQSLDLMTRKSDEKAYDAIIVANGHYDVPWIPKIKGIELWDSQNPGIIAHSKQYLNPVPYKGKKTVIVGYSASGVDIAAQISTKAKLPILVSQRKPSGLTFPAEYKRDMPEIIEFLPESQAKRALLFADGHVETDVDAILFCTGYLYSFPFLSSLDPPPLSTGERVQHLYQHIFLINYPTLAFVGLPSKIIPFRTFEAQATIVASIWSGKLDLPSKEAMQIWEDGMVQQRGLGKAFHVLEHPRDFDYHDGLLGWASKAAHPKLERLPPQWTDKDRWIRKRIPQIKGGFAANGEGRHTITSMESLGFRYEESAKVDQTTKS